MDRSKVRIGPIAASVISGALMLFYLPVIILSPPWGTDGYYKPTEYVVTSFNLYFNDSNLSIVEIQGVEEYHTAVYPPEKFNENRWIDGDAVLVYHNNEFIIQVRDERPFKATKTSNPFVLYYILYHEWFIK